MLEWYDRLRESFADILEGMLQIQVLKRAKEDVVIDGFKVGRWEDAARDVPGNSYWRVDLTTGHKTRTLGEAETRDEAKLIANEWYVNHIK